MKKVTMLFAIGLACSLLTGCASTRIRELSGAEFQTKATGIERLSSMTRTTYIGRSHDRAYLEFRSADSTTVYWSELTDLPESLVRQLSGGLSPWVPAP